MEVAQMGATQRVAMARKAGAPAQRVLSIVPGGQTEPIVVVIGARELALVPAGLGIRQRL